MASTDVNLAERSGNLLESHKGYDPRIVFFYFAMAALLLILTGGLAFQQLIRTGKHSEDERQQNQRRVIVPGPRGNIYDREGRLIVGNRPVFSVVLYVDELRAELRREQIRIRKNYREMDDRDVPSRGELEQIARVSVAQKYLDQVMAILRRDPASPDARINAAKIRKHFNSSLLLPYTLLDNLPPEDYAKLLEELPVNSPVQVYSSSSRYYPYKALAAHVLGYVRLKDNADAEDFPGEDLTTFKMKAAVGEKGLEEKFDDVLQGSPGGSIFRVDPSGFRINPPLQESKPKQGKNLITSLDIDLQQTAEDAIGDQTAAAVALDVQSGEVLMMASKPDYGDMNEFSPRASRETVERLNTEGGWYDLALNGQFPPGSTFKTIVSIAGLRSGTLDPDDRSVDCEGYLKIGNRPFRCDNGHGRHGTLDLSEAIAHSCDTYFWSHGVHQIGVGNIAAEARRVHLDQITGIELPGEKLRSIVPDPAWKKANKADEGPWTDGDTANMSIGQGYVQVTPLQMACWAASLARGETYTKPTLIHDPSHGVQHTESLGLTPQQRRIIVEGMVGCTTYGTASPLSTVEMYKIPGVRVAGKTGTAQFRVREKDPTTGESKVGNINFAWFICFAPADRPEVAMAIVIRGDTIGESFAGGDKAAPVAAHVLKKYFEKKRNPGPKISPLMKKI